jgi:ATP-dependent RNA helicase DeaD
VSWEFAPSFDAAQRATLAAGKPLIYVCPPAGWALPPLFDLLPQADGPGLQTLLLAPEISDVLDVATGLGFLGQLRPLHAATGLARTARLLAAGSVRALAATPPDALDLMRRSALKLDTLRHIAVIWPEGSLILGQSGALDTLLTEAKAAHRLIVTANDASIVDFLERHARRAPVVVAARAPEMASSALRYALVAGGNRWGTIRAALDVLNPASALVWDAHPLRAGQLAELARDPSVRVASEPGEARVALAIAADLPSAEMLASLRAIADDVLVLVRASQLSYLGKLASPLRPLRLDVEPDRARERAFQLRTLLRERIAAGALDAELMALEPLLDEHDAATVAAAALAALKLPPAVPADQPAGWVRIHVSVGKKDRVGPSDIVGALLHGAGLTKDQVGKVDLRDAFCLVEVTASEVNRAMQGLNGTTIRGKRAQARLERR